MSATASHASDAFDAFERAGWESRAADYDHHFARLACRLADPLLDAAGVGPSSRVLDVACGPGYVAGRAAERGARATGVDVADAMVDLAGRRYPAVRFLRGDAQALAFPDAAFDAVVGNLGMPHFGRPEHAVAEFRRVLEPGGRLALTTWDQPDRSPLVGVMVDAVREVGAPPPPGIPPGPDFFRFGDPDEFDAVLTGQGFTGVRVRSLTVVHPVSGPDELWAGLLRGTVRTAALIAGQPEDVIALVRAAFDRRVETYRSGPSCEIPASFRLAEATAGP